MYTNLKTIGVLGGMGAAASADFYQYLVRLSQTKYHAEQDHDFPEMFIYNLSMTGFDETGFVDPESVKNQLIAGVKKLEAAGSDFIVIPCNTVHHFFVEMQAAVYIPILNIVDVVADVAKQQGYARVGLLNSQSTRLYRLYETALAKEGIEVFSTTDSEQHEVGRVISHAIAGTQGEEDKTLLKKIIHRYSEQGAQAVVIGCTELPLAISQENTDTPLLNSTKLLAEEALRFAYGK